MMVCVLRGPPNESNVCSRLKTTALGDEGPCICLSGEVAGSDLNF